MNNTLCVTIFLNIFINFSNKTDGQTLDTDSHGCTYFGTEVVFINTYHKTTYSTPYLFMKNTDLGYCIIKLQI